jgi:hypothetical protein
MDLCSGNINQLPNKFKIYESEDSVFSNEALNAVYYSPRFLSGQEASEMPPQRYKILVKQ